MDKKKQLDQKIFNALIYLNDTQKENPTNVLNWVIDRAGNFYYYYEANSIFFWDDKDEEDFIMLANSQNEFWADDNNIPKNPNDIIDDINYYQCLIYEHVTYDFPSRPFELIKTKPGKKVRRPCPTSI